MFGGRGRDVLTWEDCSFYLLEVGMKEWERLGKSQM